MINKINYLYIFVKLFYDLHSSTIKFLKKSFYINLLLSNLEENNEKCSNYFNTNKKNNKL